MVTPPPCWQPRSFISANTPCGRPRIIWPKPGCRCGWIPKSPDRRPCHQPGERCGAATNALGTQMMTENAVVACRRASARGRAATGADFVELLCYGEGPGVFYEYLHDPRP